MPTITPASSDSPMILSVLRFMSAVRDRTKCFFSLQTLLQLPNELAVTRSPTFEAL
jgi:hypothetical protein